MPQAVGRQPLAAEAGDRSLVSIHEICGGQSGTGTGISPNTSGILSVGSGEVSTFFQSFVHLSPIAYNVST
jgi:hypothetical protein